MIIEVVNIDDFRCHLDIDYRLILDKHIRMLVLLDFTKKTQPRNFDNDLFIEYSLIT